MKEATPGISVAKKRILCLNGIRIRIRVNHGRNRIVEYVGKISAVYPSVFTFESDKGNLAFSYSDVVTKTVRFFPLNEG